MSTACSGGLRTRDLAAFNAYENVAGGLYLRRTLPVLHKGRRAPALVYIARAARRGDAAARLHRDRGRGGARLGIAGAVYSLADALGTLGMARAPGARHRRGRMSGLTIRRVVVRGRVQGVGYRAWTEDTAILNGLDGWVRNRRDGTVEAVFAGPAEAVDGMIEACRRGPDERARRCGRCRATPGRPSSPCGEAMTASRCCRRCDARAAYDVRPNSASNSRRSTASTSAIVARTPRSARLVTP